MNQAEIRNKIHEYIEVADERMLRIIHSIIEKDVENYPTDEQKRELDLRLEKIGKGEATFYTLKEVEERLFKHE